MINLLPPDVKASYRYAHRNVGLRRWIVLLVLVLIGLGGLATYGLLDIHQSTTGYQRQVTSLQAQLQKEQLAQTEKQVRDITSSLKLAVQVLSQEVLFSKLITQIGAAMPNGAVLSNLSINKTAGGLDLSANTTDYTTGTQVQVNLADPANKIFAKADIISLTCDSQNAKDPLHPCVVQVRALFNTKNPFLFINQGVKP